MHVTCMLHVASMRGANVLHACYMHVTCMLGSYSCTCMVLSHAWNMYESYMYATCMRNETCILHVCNKLCQCQCPTCYHMLYETCMKHTCPTCMQHACYMCQTWKWHIKDHNTGTYNNVYYVRNYSNDIHIKALISIRIIRACTIAG